MRCTCKNSHKPSETCDLYTAHLHEKIAKADELLADLHEAMEAELNKFSIENNDTWERYDELQAMAVRVEDGIKTLKKQIKEHEEMLEVTKRQAHHVVAFIFVALAWCFFIQMLRFGFGWWWLCFTLFFAWCGLAAMGMHGDIVEKYKNEL